MTPPPGLRLAPHSELVPSDRLSDAIVQIRDAALVGAEAEAHRDRVIGFVAQHPDALLRSCAAGHLTGSAVVIDTSRRRTLVMLHAKLGRWFQPGGHAEGDANLAGVALREAGEETGIGGLAVVIPAIDIDVHPVAVPGEEQHLHLDLRFLVLVPPGAAERANHESTALRWVDLGELDDLRPPVDPSTRRLVARGLQLTQNR